MYLIGFRRFRVFKKVCVPKIGFRGNAPLRNADQAIEVAKPFPRMGRRGMQLGRSPKKVCVPKIGFRGNASLRNADQAIEVAGAPSENRPPRYAAG